MCKSISIIFIVLGICNFAFELSNSQGKKTNWFRLRALSFPLWLLQPLAFFYCFGWIENTSDLLHFSVKARTDTEVSFLHATLTHFNNYTLLWHHTKKDTFWVLSFDPHPPHLSPLLPVMRSENTDKWFVLWEHNTYSFLKHVSFRSLLWNWEYKLIEWNYRAFYLK